MERFATRLYKRPRFVARGRAAWRWPVCASLWSKRRARRPTGCTHSRF